MKPFSTHLTIEALQGGQNNSHRKKVCRSKIILACNSARNPSIYGSLKSRNCDAAEVRAAIDHMPLSAGDLFLSSAPLTVTSPGRSLRRRAYCKVFSAPRNYPKM
jgi:hypothetical protein